jgi:hypothetical protein
MLGGKIMPGTTPKHIFNIGLTASVIKEVKIMYFQKDIEKLVKRTADCDIKDGEIAVRLTQEDTFKFDGQENVAIYIRILTPSGDAIASEPMIVSVSKCLDTEVLV